MAALEINQNILYMSNQWGSLNGERGKGLEVVAPSGIGARELKFRLCSSALGT